MVNRRVGKKIGWVREEYLNRLRVGVAHALLKTGELGITLDNLEHIQQVNKWLPPCRIPARMMLRNEFPTEFGLPTKPLLSERALSRPSWLQISITLFTVSGTNVKVTRNWQSLDIRPGGGLAIHKLA